MLQNSVVNRVNKAPLLNPKIELKKPVLNIPLNSPLKKPLIAPGTATGLKPPVTLKAPIKLNKIELPVEEKVVSKNLGSEDTVDPVNGFDKAIKTAAEVVAPPVVENETTDISAVDIAKETADSSAKAEVKPAVQETKKTRHRRSKTEIEAAKKQEETEVQTTELETGEEVEIKSLVATDEEMKQRFVYSFPTTDMTLMEATRALNLGLEDEEWQAEKDGIIKKLAEVVISDDMTVGPIAIGIAKLAHLRDEIWLPYNIYRNAYSQLSRHDSEGFVERTRIMNSIGTNDLQRRRAGIMACMNYKSETSSSNINLYEILDSYSIRSSFYRDAMNQIQMKLDCLKTLNFGLNTDSKMLPYTEG